MMRESSKYTSDTANNVSENLMELKKEIFPKVVATNRLSICHVERLDLIAIKVACYWS
jgi:hypothetical protein